MALILALPSRMPVHLWAALPCVGKVSTNAGTRAPKDVARKAACQSRLWSKLFDSFLALAAAIFARGGSITLEWPAKSRHWSDVRVKRLMEVGDVLWTSASMRATRPEGKCRWRIATTMSGLAEAIASQDLNKVDNVTDGKYPMDLPAVLHKAFKKVRVDAVQPFGVVMDEIMAIESRHGSCWCRCLRAFC